MSDEAAVPVLGVGEMEAVARLWRATRRELVCRFGGASMAPAVPPQTEVRLLCGEPGRAGDVIAFLAGGRVMVHRIVALSERQGWILTRGDARLLPDAPIRDPRDVIGRVAAVRLGAAFEPPSPAPTSLAGRVVLWPLVTVLRAAPSAGARVIEGLVAGRRGLLHTLAPLRARALAALRAGRGRR